MGRFILSRDASGVRFLLESDTGRTLAVSKQYATLDAAKKGICSLVYYAPIIPLIDTTVGESAPNPKFELLQEKDGFAYAMKSANGKVVIAAGGFATRKACLRAVSMLRTGVQGAEVLLAKSAGLSPLTVGAMVRDPAPVAALEDTLPLPTYGDTFEVADEPLADVEIAPVVAAEEAPAPIVEVPVETPAEVPTPTTEAPVTAPPAGPRVPRRVVLRGEGAITPRAVPQKAPEAPTKDTVKARKNGILSKFFKR